MIDLEKLYQIINTCTFQTRKGAAVTEKDHGDIKVIEVMAMPTTDELVKKMPDAKLIDVHFMVIGVDMLQAKIHHISLINILKSFPSARELFARGPSYITLGGFVGDQGAALSLMALGEALEMWKVITPAKLGLSGAQADNAAGGGYVMISPWELPA